MHTLVRASFVFACMLAFFAAPQAKAIIIYTNYSVTSDSTFNEDVIVISGGTLTITSGVTMTVASAYSVTVTNGATINALPYSTIMLELGTFFTTSGSNVTLATASRIVFSPGGTLHLMGGNIACNSARIIGLNPYYHSSIVMDDGDVIQGTCDFVNLCIALNAAFWQIDAGSTITLYDDVSIMDPTGSGTHYISLEGTLRFENGNFYINTDVATLLANIMMYNGSELHAHTAHIEAIPHIIATDGTLILSDNSEWLFFSSSGIDTQGDITMSNTQLDAYLPLVGWNGIYMHDGYATLTLDYTTVYTVNSIAYHAIDLERTTGNTHFLDHCTIAHPLNMNSGDGVHLEGPDDQTIDCILSCTYIGEFDKGVYAGFQSNTEIVDCIIINNNIGCHFQQSDQSRIEQSSIREIYSIGLWYDNALSNELTLSEVTDANSYDIYVDNNSELNGDENNIYPGSGSPAYLVAVYNNSDVNLDNCWWDYYPPNMGHELWCDGTSNFNFTWVGSPNYISGYQSCSIVFPKATPRDEAVSQAISAQITAQNYPNPFNPSTQIEFTIPEAMNIVLSVYTLNGQRIATIANDYYYEGTHTVTFHAPPTMASGTYMYVLNTPFGAKHGMMVLTK